MFWPKKTLKVKLGIQETSTPYPLAIRQLTLFEASNFKKKKDEKCSSHALMEYHDTNHINLSTTPNNMYLEEESF